MLLYRQSASSPWKTLSSEKNSSVFAGIRPRGFSRCNWSSEAAPGPARREVSGRDVRGADWVKQMQTAILNAYADLSGSVSAAVQLLRLNSVVAIPTETVYGLAGNALAPEAAAKIFEAKERPYFDPLIIHIGDDEWLSRLARPGSADSPLVVKMIERFWPGPLTILLPKTDLVPDIVTAGLQNVAIRMPNHPVFTR